MKKIFLIGLLISAFGGVSCGSGRSLLSSAKKPSENECLKRFIKKEIEESAILSEIPVNVESVNNGSVELHISANSKRIISDKSILAIRRGENLQNIQQNDSLITFLIELEKKIKKMPQIQTVSWTADEPCRPGFVCQTTGTSEIGADENEVDKSCAE